MVDALVIDARGDGRVWGRSKVDPKAWFFEAHFPQDPVWPGSLGLEGFFQAAKALWAELFRPGDDPSALSVSWQAPFSGLPHRWLYRGQVTPSNKDVAFGLKVVGQKGSVITLKGLMWVDGQAIYQVDDLTVGLAV
jgi:3-hydroxymyristoyl/3-hydroxydecanoyl-(acyl carrier protein) dehydratase